MDPIIQCYHRLSNATVVLLLFFISWDSLAIGRRFFFPFSRSRVCSHTLFLRFKPLGNACLRLYGCRDRVEGFLCFSLSDALLQDTGGPLQLVRVSQPTHPSSSGHTHAVIGFCWSFFLSDIYEAMAIRMFATNSAADARGSFVTHTSFAASHLHSTRTGQNEQYTSRPIFSRARTAPNELLREMQGLQIRTPVNAGNYKMTTSQTSKNDVNDQEMLTPPSTPAQTKLEEQLPSRRSLDASHVPELNFSPDVSRAELLGEGVWSKVYRISATPLSQPQVGRPLTPPSTPYKSFFGLPQQYAIKTATRSDAAAVFQAEANILTHIQSYDSSADYVVPFLGLCTSTPTPSLLFHCADAGTLESLIESSTSLPLPKVLDLFLHILPQLTHALFFLHTTTNTIHADIKPANILLNSTISGQPLARLADFSTAFVASSQPSQHSGGGTWSFMAPEQLSLDPCLSTPSFAPDVYSLGITLLAFLCGGNPFSSLLSNNFRLREAVKMGDAISWGMQEPAFEQRIGALQKGWESRGGEGNLLKLVAGAVRKKREDRWDAGEWCRRVDEALVKVKREKEEVVGLGIKC